MQTSLSFMFELHGINNMPQYHLSLISLRHSSPFLAPTTRGILPHLATVRCAHDSALTRKGDAAGTLA